jgi:hypothetical protein
MRAEQKHLHLEPDPATLPAELEWFSFIARRFIRPPDSPSEESFDVVVCSQQCVAARCREVRAVNDARHHLVVDVEQFDERRRAAGERYQDWNRGPFTGESQDHISVPEVTAAPAG